MSFIYSASLTGEPFLFYEIRQVAKLKIKGLTDKEIREEIKKKNLFQYDTEKSINKRLAATLKRIKVLDEEMVSILAEGASDTAKTINLYSIMLTNKLLFDFIAEVIAEKIKYKNYVLEKKDLNEFFIAKGEQNEKVAKWKDYTIKKLKQVLLRIITEAGILKDKEAGTMQKVHVDKAFAESLTDSTGKILLSLLDY